MSLGQDFVLDYESETFGATRERALPAPAAQNSNLFHLSDFPLLHDRFWVKKSDVFTRRKDRK